MGRQCRHLPKRSIFPGGGDGDKNRNSSSPNSWDRAFLTHRCSGWLSNMLLFGSGSPWRPVDDTAADGLGVAAADTKP